MRRKFEKTDRRAIKNKLEKTVEKMNEIQSLQEEYIKDTEKYEGLFEYVSNLEGIDADVKKEYLQSIKESYGEMVVSYQENIEDAFKEEKELMEDTFIEINKKEKEYENVEKEAARQSFSSLAQGELKVATDSIKSKASSERKEYNKMGADFSKQLQLRMEQNERVNRQIRNSKLSGK